MVKRKRFITFLVVLALTTVMLESTAFAGGHCGGSNRVSYSSCSVTDCNLTNNHTHSGKNYYGHYLNDGHSYHQLCAVEDCVLTTIHKHDDVTYFGHYPSDGHDYHDDFYFGGGYGQCARIGGQY